MQYKDISIPYSRNGHYSNNGKKIYKNDCSKIISSTSKSHAITPKGFKSGIGAISHAKPLPQLSPRSIQLLVDYYNEHKCMPENIEVEYKCFLPEISCSECKVTIKCNSSKNRFAKIVTNFENQVSTTIPEVEGKLYTEKEVMRLCSQAWLKYCNNNTCLEDFKEWFNSKKK